MGAHIVVTVATVAAEVANVGSDARPTLFTEYVGPRHNFIMTKPPEGSSFPAHRMTGTAPFVCLGLVL